MSDLDSNKVKAQLATGKHTDGKFGVDMYMTQPNYLGAVLYSGMALEAGSDKGYVRHSWLTMLKDEKAPIDAAYRHLNKHVLGEKYDAETGLLHLGMAACEVLMGLAKVMQTEEFTKAPAKPKDQERFARTLALAKQLEEAMKVSQ